MTIVAPETWIELDSNKGSEKYLQEMATEGWAGGIELVGCSHMLHVNLHVYEAVDGGGGSIKRIGCFNCAPKQPERTVHVLYRDGCHYDALDVDSKEIKAADAAAQVQAEKAAEAESARAAAEAKREEAAEQRVMAQSMADEAKRVADKAKREAEEQHDIQHAIAQSVVAVPLRGMMSSVEVHLARCLALSFKL